MPAPAPADRRVIFCPVESPIACENADPSADPIWMIGPSRPTDAPDPIDSAEASDLMTATMPRMLPRLIVDRVHHLGDAMTFGLRREAFHQIDDDEAAEDRRQDHPVSEPAWPLENVGVVGDLEHAVEHGVMDEADERPQRHRADAGHDPDAQSEEAEHEQIYAPFFPIAGGDRLGRNGGISSR